MSSTVVTPPTRTILVTGGTGAIGQAVVRALAARGDAVVATTRGSRAVPGATRTVRWLPGAEPLPEAASEGCDAVVSLAGAPVAARRWTRREKARILNSRLTVTRGVVAAVLAARVPVLVSASAVGYYGDGGEAVIDEAAVPASDFRARVCRAWEDAALTASAAGTRVVLLRIGTALDRSGPLRDRLALFSRLGGRSLGNGRQWVPWVHIDDVVGLILLALDDASIVGPLNVTAPEPVRQRDLSRAISRTLGRPSLFRVPAWLLSLVVGESATFILSSQRVVPARALRHGYRFRHPGCAAAVTELWGGR